MKWGTFTPVHWATIAAAIAAYVLLEITLKRVRKETQVLVLGILSFSGIAAVIYNLVMWGSPWEYLPLHLCSLNALVLPVAVWSRNKVLGNLLLLWSLGAFVAIVINTAVAEVELLSWTFFFYYVPHVLECAIPVLLFRLRLIRVDARCLVSTVGITVAVYTVIHGINLLLNHYFIQANITNAYGEVIWVNYMYSIQPTDPVLGMLYQWMPVSYWYIYLAIPIIVVYLAVVYGIVYLRRHIRKKRGLQVR